LDSIKQNPRPSLARQEAAFVLAIRGGEETETTILIAFLKRTFGINWVEPENIKKIDDGNTIKVSNGKNHVLIRSADDLILNGKKIEKFNIYSASGNYI
jgi:hypothetical protein